MGGGPGAGGGLIILRGGRGGGGGLIILRGQGVRGQAGVLSY